MYLEVKMENLKLLRREKKLSQAELAKLLGLSYRGYQNIEYGYCETGYENLKKIADFFNCSIDYLLGHQTKNIIYIDSLTPIQQKLFELIKKLTDEQGLFLIGYISDMLKIPYDDVKPVRPW